MSEPQFFPPAPPVSLADVVGLTEAVAPLGADSRRLFQRVAALDQAGPHSVSYCAEAGDLEALARTRAGACFVTPDAAALLPSGTIALVTADPLSAFAKIAAAFYPGGGRPASLFTTRGLSPDAFIHAEARLEGGVTVDPGAIIGPKAEIGSGTIIGAHCVIGPDVRIGRDCAIGPQVSIVCALIGNGVSISPGARIGQAAPVIAGAAARIAGPGRVIIQDRVEIGANTTVDRGGLRDTVVGEGSRIGNLVHIETGRTIARLSVV